MEQYASYAEMLTDYTNLAVGLMIVTLIAAITLTVVCVKVKYKRMVLSTAVGGIALALAIYFICIFPYQRDISENAYKTYVGEFYVEECYTVSRGGTYILLRCGDEDGSTRYKVLCDAETVENETTYTGSFSPTQGAPNVW